ncbi:MAG TPA: CPBP family intramembrane metalloprotease [Ignavibacteriaceae bacterium]|nr:CPBP family intramembrane metalloprotease [Ignavibacteriaceae bacterium]
MDGQQEIEPDNQDPSGKHSAEILRVKNSDNIEMNFDFSPIAAGFIGLFGGFFLYQFVGGFLTLLVLGFDIENAPVTPMRLMTIAGQILFILLPALLFAKFFYNNVSAVMRIKIPELKEFSLFTIGIIILTPMLQTYLYIQNYFIEVLAKNNQSVQTLKSFFDSLDQLVEKTYGELLNADSFPEMFFVVLAAAIVPAVCEESMFRGFIQKSFEMKIKPFYAALITAVFFGLYHFNPYGLLPLITLGLFFGFAAYKSNSILIPIFLHFINNLTAVVLYFIFGEEELNNSIALSGEDLLNQLILFFILILFFTALIISITKYYNKQLQGGENASMSEL